MQERIQEKAKEDFEEESSGELGENVTLESFIDFIDNNPDYPIKVEIHPPQQQYQLVSRFLGPYIHPTTKKQIPAHEGLDLGAPVGTPIYPILPGVVTKTQQDGKTSNTLGGTCVYTEHKFNGVTYNTYNAHCDQTTVSEGTIVSPEDQIATVGRTGNAVNSGPHNHFTIKINGSYVDPLKLFNTKIDAKAKDFLPYITDETKEFIYETYFKAIQKEAYYKDLNKKATLFFRKLVKF